MKKFLVLAMVLLLSGCASWNKLSDPEKAAFIVSGAILVGVAVMRNDNDGATVNKVCVSTRSIQTGCGDAQL